MAFQASFFDLNVSKRAVQTSHETEAITTPQAHLTVNGGGLTLDAHSVSTATIDQIDALDLSAIDISLVESTAEAGGKTNAFIDEGATLDADAINLTADSNNSAKINNFQFKIGFVDLEFTKPQAHTTHTTSASIGPASNVERSVDSGFRCR